MSKLTEIERAIEILCEIENLKTEKLMLLFDKFELFEAGSDLINEANIGCFNAIMDVIGRFEYWKREEIRKDNNEKNGVISIFEFTPIRSE